MKTVVVLFALVLCSTAYGQSDLCKKIKMMKPEYANYQCGREGWFHPVQCIPVDGTTECRCVSPRTGDMIGQYRITDLLMINGMNCLCAVRSQLSVDDKFKPKCLANGNFETKCNRMYKIPAKLRICTVEGHFKSSVCSLAKCSCIDTFTGESMNKYTDLKIPKYIDCRCAQDTLDDRKLHDIPCRKNGNYDWQKYPCFESRFKAGQILRDTPDADIHMDTCETTGGFSPVQCFKISCWCVDPFFGNQIRNYKALVGDTLYATMNCECALAQYHMVAISACLSNGNYEPYRRCVSWTAVTPSLICEEDGSYKAKQCVDNRCTCVDVNTGSQVAEYEFPPKDTGANCKCATHERLYRANNMMMRANCMHNGNYMSCTNVKSINTTVICEQLRPMVLTFAPKQCRDKWCHCVNKYGTRLTKPIHFWEAEDMKCKCALRADRDFLKGKSTRYNCNTAGNFFVE